MRDIETFLKPGKNLEKKNNRRAKSFGYQVLGFGAGGRTVGPYIAALGGTVLTNTCYKTHVFTGDGTFVVENEGTGDGSNTVEYFVIAGGGPGGGKYRGGGAGGGGWRTNYPSPAFGGVPVTFTGYPIQVGAGGGNPGSRYTAATPSIFSTITSTRGGSHGQPGGSGGGGNGTSGSYGNGNAGSFSPPEGNRGGESTGGCSPGAGGGGGASSIGNNGAPGFTSPAGSGGNGSGIATGFFGPTAPSYGTPGPSGANRYFSGGGGGGTYSPGSAGGGGYGGGGTVFSPSPANSGGGGGGGTTGGGCCSPSFGGSGLVAIRYKFQ
tara:strand:- start:6383 stop:7348 length:966 start_codon:yes stop_codon:yes gene_type:complete